MSNPWRRDASVRHEELDPSTDFVADEPPTPAQIRRVTPSERQRQTVATIRIARFWPGSDGVSDSGSDPGLGPLPVIVDAEPSDGGLDAFDSEVIEPAEAAPAPAPRIYARHATPSWPAWKWAALIALIASAVVSTWGYQRRLALPETGFLTIQTTPSGLPVAINDQAAGVTPLTRTLAPADYAIQVGTTSQRRTFSVKVLAGSTILQHLELSADAVPGPATGALHVQTEPSGQAVTVDDVVRGQSPLTIAALPPGNYAVSLRGPAGVVRRTVAVTAGETVSLVVSSAPPAPPAPGWLSVRSTARLEIREDGKLLGTTETDQLMLPAGDHHIQLVNESIGYRSDRHVRIGSAKTEVLTAELPFGSLSINAQPWAEVWIDGERVGETPIANLPRRLGSYEVTFRHPQLGERRETVLVTLRQAARLGVDMRGK